MSAKQKEIQEPELDEDGIQVLHFEKTVLFIVSPDGFGEQALGYSRSALSNIRIASKVASTRYDEPLKGRLQEEFLADGQLADETLEGYAGVVVCSSDSDELSSNEDVLRLLREAAAADKPIGAVGNGTAALAAAGIIRGKRVTGRPDCAETVRAAGGKYTGRQVEVTDKIVTCVDESSGLRFGRLLVEVFTA